MIVFADTNWLEAMYFEARNDDRDAVERAATVARRMRKMDGPITVSQIVMLEARNVFGRISRERNPTAWQRLQTDLNKRVIVDPFDWPALRQETNRIFERFSHKASIGSFDAAIVASAKLTNAVELLSFDEQVKAIATCLGMRIWPALGVKGKNKMASLKG